MGDSRPFCISSPLHLCINGRFLGRPVTGVERFARETLSAIHAELIANPLLSEKLRITILTPATTVQPDDWPQFGFKRLGRFNGHAWEQYDLPRHVPSDAILVNLCNTAPLFFKRQIAVLHDAATVAAPDGYSLAFRTWYRLMMATIMRRAAAVATVSRFSQTELNRFFGPTKRPITVLPEGVDHIRRTKPTQNVRAKYGLQSRPFVLAVSSLQANKNFSLLVEAVNRLDQPAFDVAIAGGSGHKSFASSGVSAPPFVKQLGFVPDEDLAALYCEADCFVFPSRYEGFGLPPVEAMALGCPLLSSDAASLPEVCGDAALYFSPDDAVQLERLLIQVMGDPQMRDIMRVKGLDRVKTMTWRQTALDLVELAGKLTVN